MGKSKGKGLVHRVGLAWQIKCEHRGNTCSCQTANYLIEKDAMQGCMLKTGKQGHRSAQLFIALFQVSATRKHISRACHAVLSKYSSIKQVLKQIIDSIKQKMLQNVVRVLYYT